MALQFSDLLRNARLDAILTLLGDYPVLRIRSGDPPAALEDEDTGDILVEYTLADGWWAAAVGGVKALTSSIPATDAIATGTAGHFRIYAEDPSGDVAHLQGTTSEAGGGGDMILGSVSIEAGKSVAITSFTLTDGNAGG